MNWAHIHLLLNHIPVLGTVFGLALLGYALARRNDALKKAALDAFVAVALLALPAYFTGEPAEEVVESAAGISKGAIDAHEDAALISLIGVEVLGVVALIGLVVASRGRPVAAKTTGAVLVVSLAAAGLMAWTANLGGQIHHEEIRAGAPPPVAEHESGEDR
jgi:uncharacterized membrane protein